MTMRRRDAPRHFFADFCAIHWSCSGESTARIARVALKSEFRDASANRGTCFLRRFDVLIWAVGINAAATIAILGVLLRH